jgi:hypothetical protein
MSNKIMKKYIVIDTWNGEGYSSENGVDTKQFNNRKSALKWAYERALSNAQGVESDVMRYSEMRYTIVKPTDNGDGYCFVGANNDNGSYQVWETKDTYAFMIMCNINDVIPLTKKKFEDEIDEIEHSMNQFIVKSEYMAKGTNWEEEFKYPQDNGDVFYTGFDDYDYQFRLINNLKIK